jgi:uncharacterized membrane protein YphA (DoxX/SURF4 family)
MLFAISKPATILHAKPAVVWLRILSSLAWLDSAFVGRDAKVAPAFLHGNALAERISTTFVHTAIDARVAQLLTTYVLPHAAVFALLIACADAAAGVSLAFGLCVRLGAAIAIARALVNILVAGGAGTDAIGYNALLIAAGGICIATAAGRKCGVDAGLIDRFPRSSVLRMIA